MPLTNKTKYALLGILNLYPMSGYDLKKFCDDVVSQFWHENYAHIYPVLKELEKSGLATKETVQTKGRPSKNVYYITEKGKDELKEWLLRPAEALPARYEFILKLFFSSDIPSEHLVNVIRQFRAENEKALEILARSERDAKADKTAENQKSIDLMLITINCGRHESEAMIKWCDETLEILKTMP
jgi:PadR family transcriptional regulator, regulatory protein AphA